MSLVKNIKNYFSWKDRDYLFYDDKDIHCGVLLIDKDNSSSSVSFIKDFVSKINEKPESGLVINLNEDIEIENESTVIKSGLELMTYRMSEMQSFLAKILVNKKVLIINIKELEQNQIEYFIGLVTESLREVAIQERSLNARNKDPEIFLVFNGLIKNNSGNEYHKDAFFIFNAIYSRTNVLDFYITTRALGIKKILIEDLDKINSFKNKELLCSALDSNTKYTHILDETSVVTKDEKIALRLKKGSEVIINFKDN